MTTGSDIDNVAVGLAEALCMSIVRRHEPDVRVPWVSRDRDIQRAMDALRCHLTGDPLPPYSESDLPRYLAEMEAAR
jgi:hypothetical protein